MRLAISGTHGSGKTTLAEDFLAGHSGYRHVPEPYEALSEAGVAFSDPPTIADYAEQLEASIATLHAHAGEPDVVFERCPLDFLAYLAVLDRRGRGGRFDGVAMQDEVAEALATLDLIAFLPLPPDGTMAAELPAMQRAMDRALRSLFANDPLGLLVEGKPRVVALRGTPAERLAALHRSVARGTLA